MIVQVKRIILFLWIFISPVQSLFSQQFSKNNYTGAWENPTSWSPTWFAPQHYINPDDITINGYITVTGNLTFTGTSNMIINDTLVINGDLSLDNYSDLTINNNAVLIIRGSLYFLDNSNIIANGYLIITGDIHKTGSISAGTIKSNGNPVKIYIGGTIYPVGLSNDKILYPAVNCSSSPTTPYPGTNCSYGNMTDILNDPIYPFFQSGCAISTPTITSSGPITFCQGGSVILTSTQASTFLWSNGETTQAINVTATGSYSVKVINAAGCQSISSSATLVTVNALPATPTIIADGPIAFCNGGNVTLTSTSASTFLWSNGATTQAINVTSTGSYSVKVINAAGCQSVSSDSISVTVNALPATPIITADGATTFCTGGSVILTSTSASTFLWSNTATTQAINITATGSYSVKVINAAGCQSISSAATVVTVNALPATPTITADGATTFCTGGSVFLTSTSASTFLWSNGATTQAINVTSTGNYSVKVINAAGCQSASSAATVVTVNALPATPTITADGPITFCNGGNVTLTSTSASASTFLWSNGATTQAINVTSTGSYSVKVINAAGCQSASLASTTVTVNDLPATPTITVDGPTTFCIGGNVTLTSTSTSTFLWSNAANTSNITVSEAGNYSVRVTDSNGCQSAVSAPTIITVNTFPSTPTITADGPLIFCTGGSVPLTSTSASTFLWSNGATTQSINVTATGSYSVMITNAAGCQSASSEATVVTVNALPVTPIITADGHIAFCIGGNVTLTSTSASAWLWSNGATTQSVNVIATGSYSVKVINAAECQSASSASTTVTVNDFPATPTITVDGPTTFCIGGNVTLTSTSASTFLWSNGATTQSINVTATGSYSVKVTNAAGCQSVSSAATLVRVYDLPATPTIKAEGPTTFCPGSSVILTSTSASASAYYWSNGAITHSVTVKETGSYLVRVTDINGCQSIVSAPFVVSVTEMPVAFAGPDQELKNVFETKLDAEMPAFGAGEWSLISGSGQIKDIHSPVTGIIKLPAGETVFLWKVINGICEARDEVKITVYDLVIPSVITPDGDGKNDYFRISGIKGHVDLTIFNSRGNIEYTNRNYVNDWDGRNNKGIELPGDTYFYILKFDDFSVKKGSVLIKR